MAMANQNL